MAAVKMGGPCLALGGARTTNQSILLDEDQDSISPHGRQRSKPLMVLTTIQAGGWARRVAPW